MSIQIYNRANVNPGSPAAVASGCTCAVHDNHHGEGIPDGDAPARCMASLRA